MRLGTTVASGTAATTLCTRTRLRTRHMPCTFMHASACNCGNGFGTPLSFARQRSCRDCPGHVLANPARIHRHTRITGSKRFQSKPLRVKRTHADKATSRLKQSQKLKLPDACGKSRGNEHARPDTRFKTCFTVHVQALACMHGSTSATHAMHVHDGAHARRYKRQHAYAGMYYIKLRQHGGT